MKIRTATNADSEEIIALISSIYDEYGEIMYTDGADRDLLDIHRHYHESGGDFVVLENDQKKIVGSHATLPKDKSAGLLTFRRLYLEKTMRGSGAGKTLMDWAVKWTEDHNYKRVEFWSDTRFKRAHQFFENYGFQKTGEIRDMDDGALPYSEYFFSLNLSS
ncbi:MAG: GNAT family N-acetyltransferase [Verrucomicrobiales bacterium]|jgi:putative acetyltransferase|nr:GNAT family N-acetyltransferase [Akkermansiaceae bacterium]MDG1852956.1 GNAT family N-acetyltransferase [Verrucomicrobiales bacterium]MDP6858643.1 GNAT family N-acetyltransferase [Verrucomicrobiales bacterium]